MERDTTVEPQIGTVLIDFGGVIAEEGFMNGLRYMAKEQDLDPDTVFHEAVEIMYSCGYLVGKAQESTFWNTLAERTGLNGDQAAKREALLSRFIVRPRMLEIVAMLAAQGRQVAMLSDQTDWLDALNEKYEIFPYFHRVFNSYHEGMHKRQPEFFHHALEELGATAELALFIDDSARHVALARELGLAAIHFDTLAQVERELGEILPDMKPLLEQPPYCRP
ncbi:HAD family hydrolase [Oceanidesulfovibrio indonesiensis]|nr:HAD family phosphatase [Oceanidesulfovibrio indonesiensis]